MREGVREGLGEGGLWKGEGRRCGTVFSSLDCARLGGGGSSGVRCELIGSGTSTSTSTSTSSGGSSDANGHDDED
jgi:hypothetical protein